MYAFESAHEHRACLVSEPFLVKNRVWFSVYQGSWKFQSDFSCEKSPAQFVFGFGYLEPRPVWVENGVSSHVPSRLKGIETHLSGLGTGYWLH